MWLLKYNIGNDSKNVFIKENNFASQNNNSSLEQKNIGGSVSNIPQFWLIHFVFTAVYVN